jgi:multidrug efflux pump subunit AcrA (membrane-fusion protein)
MRIKLMALSLITVLIFSLVSSCSVLNLAKTHTPTPQSTSPAVSNNTVSASGEVVPGTWVSLGFPSGGQNLQILVKAGQLVDTSTLIATVDDLSPIAAVKSANAQVSNAVATLNRLKDQEAKGLDITAAQNALAAAYANLDLANQALYSPINGSIIEINAHDGEYIAPGQPFITIADMATLHLETTDMSEVDAVRVHVGDSADISFDALPNEAVIGKVTNIALKKSSGSGVYYTITIALDTVPENLRWGMSAFAVIKIQ